MALKFGNDVRSRGIQNRGSRPGPGEREEARRRRDGHAFVRHGHAARVRQAAIDGIVVPWAAPDAAGSLARRLLGAPVTVPPTVLICAFDVATSNTVWAGDIGYPAARKRSKVAYTDVVSTDDTRIVTRLDTLRIG
jgi:hypothetical protein